MNLDIKLHKQDLPDEIKFSDKIAIDCEFTGLNVERDRLCLLQISSGENDAHIIGIDISKQLQTSDFGGELSDKQLKYCAQDVVYLHKIYASLKKILEREKRIDLYNETIMFINTRVKLDFASFKDDIWSH